MGRAGAEPQLRQHRTREVRDGFLEEVILESSPQRRQDIAGEKPKKNTPRRGNSRGKGIEARKMAMFPWEQRLLGLPEGQQGQVPGQRQPCVQGSRSHPP